MKAPMPATAISLPLLDAVAISWTSPPVPRRPAVPWTDHPALAGPARAWSGGHAPWVTTAWRSVAASAVRPRR
jgi:hypothetical protein